MENKLKDIELENVTGGVGETFNPFDESSPSDPGKRESNPFVLDSEDDLEKLAEIVNG